MRKLKSCLGLVAVVGFCLALAPAAQASCSLREAVANATATCLASCLGPPGFCGLACASQGLQNGAHAHVTCLAGGADPVVTSKAVVYGPQRRDPAAAYTPIVQAPEFTTDGPDLIGLRD